jgi:hypothetical protein
MTDASCACSISPAVGALGDHAGLGVRVGGHLVERVAPDAVVRADEAA